MIAVEFTVWKTSSNWRKWHITCQSIFIFDKVITY